MWIRRGLRFGPKACRNHSGPTRDTLQEVHDMSDDPSNMIKTTIPLPVGHGWTCKPGNNLFIAERGAAAFEIPADWIIRHDGKQTVSIHDLPPPKDSCRIALTIFHLPPVKGGWGA